ncbi:MAG: hypothetical protein ABEI75_02970 [Halobaculum sp.]
MGYLSHAVRRIRAEPDPDATVTLVVEIDPDGLGRSELADRVAACDGEVLEALPFDSYRVRLPETAVADFCETSGLVTVETANVLGTGDAGEDV